MSPIKFFGHSRNSKSDVWLGGVCGGFGFHTPVPSWVRGILFLVRFLCLGTVGIAYLVLWIYMPDERSGKNR